MLWMEKGAASVGSSQKSLTTLAALILAGFAAASSRPARQARPRKWRSSTCAAPAVSLAPRNMYIYTHHIRSVARGSNALPYRYR